ncbi:MAG: DinB family protein [Dehalococcoidia bacterium]|nr:DinB family protein [Dehalococcoidia bacterium]
MATSDFIRDSFARLHKSLQDSTSDLTVEQLNFTPDQEHHSIAWILWHAYRTADVIGSRLLWQSDERWARDGWASRLGMPEAGQGTGHSPDEAHAIHIEDLGTFMGYADGVIADCDAYLAPMSDEDLQQPRPWRNAPSGEEPIAAIIGNHVMTHIYGHRNEIYWLRSLQGLKGSPN